VLTKDEARWIAVNVAKLPDPLGKAVSIGEQPWTPMWNAFVHGVAFLCGISTPSLSAQGQQRRPFNFNIKRDDSVAAPGHHEHRRPSTRAARSFAAVTPRPLRELVRASLLRRKV
jgi:hypothetical protein